MAFRLRETAGGSGLRDGGVGLRDDTTVITGPPPRPLSIGIERWCITPDATTGKDTYLSQGIPTLTEGTANILSVAVMHAVGGFGTPDEFGARRTVIEFDLSLLPATAVQVVGAYLRLYLYSNISPAAAYACHAYRLTQSAWSEADASWNKYDASNNWASAGGDYSLADGVPFTIPNAETQYFDITGLTPLVQDAIDNQQRVLRLLLRMDNETDTGTSHGAFLLSSNAVLIGDQLKPSLCVDYDITAGGIKRATLGADMVLERLDIDYLRELRAGRHNFLSRVRGQTHEVERQVQARLNARWN